MISFRSALPAIVRRSKRATRLLLLFDFDGTLSEIVLHPAKAKMMAGWRKRLLTLNRKRNVSVGIVTGRSLADIRKRARVPGIIYAASHGFEIMKGSKRLLSIGREHHQPLKRVANSLADALRNIANTKVEHKGTAVAVHYRRVKRSRHAVVKRRVREVARPLLEQHGWELTGGKMVIEVRPTQQWNKGDAVRWIWKNVAPRALPFES